MNVAQMLKRPNLVPPPPKQGGVVAAENAAADGQAAPAVPTKAEAKAGEMMPPLLKAVANAAEPKAVPAKAEAKAAVAAAEPQADDGEDLEIPSFLRRLAN